MGHCEMVNRNGMVLASEDTQPRALPSGFQHCGW